MFPEYLYPAVLPEDLPEVGVPVVVPQGAPQVPHLRLHAGGGDQLEVGLEERGQEERDSQD